MEEAFVENGEIEVSSKEVGFKGVWYRAILEENPTKTRQKKLKVRYLTLLNDDGSSHLREMIDQKFIRPVPPVDLYEDDDVVLEEGSVVDADHNKGWWTGLVIKKSEDENNFWVYFDFPPDIVRFGRNQLRVHFDWTGFEWVRPEIQKELRKSEFRPGTMVEVSSIDEAEVAWLPAMIIKEIEEEVNDDEKKKKFIVKYCKRHYLNCNSNGDDEAIRPNETVGSHCVRPTPPLPMVEEEEHTLLDRVEAFCGCLGWREGTVIALLPEKRYVVRFESIKREFVFRQSDVRPFRVWENGVWHNGSKQNQVKKKPLKAMTPKTPKRSSNVMNPEETVAATGEIGKTNDKAPMVLLTPPQVTSIEAKETHENTLETLKKNQNDSTRKKIPEKKKEIGDDEPLSSLMRKIFTAKGFVSPVTATPCRKRRRDEEEGRNSSETEISPAQTPLNAVNLPFEKKSPYWETCGTLEGFKTQCPHFSPLLNEVKEDMREWSAIGMLVTYEGLLKKVKNLRLDEDSTNRFNSLKDSFAKLARHGFDVETPQKRISKILSLKEKREKKAKEKKLLKEKVEEEDRERRKLDEEVAEMERKIIELKRAAKDKKKDVEKMIIDMKSSEEVIDQEIEEVELEFQKLYRLHGKVS